MFKERLADLQDFGCEVLFGCAELIQMVVLVGLSLGAVVFLLSSIAPAIKALTVSAIIILIGSTSSQPSSTTPLPLD